MAKARSPQYPVIGLKEAIDKVTAVYKEDYQNQVPRDVIARHMGYASINGKSLGVLAALSKYGLLEGRGDNSRVSDLAVRIIAHAPGEPERAQAIQEAALRPALFAELEKRYPDGKGSDAAIRSYLLIQKFIPSAADTVIRAYRETKLLVEAECGAYPAEEAETEYSGMNVQSEPIPQAAPVAFAAAQQVETLPGNRRAVFDLTEGEVVITFPDELSPESVSDLQDYLNVFMKKARREAGVTEQ